MSKNKSVRYNAERASTKNLSDIYANAMRAEQKRIAKMKAMKRRKMYGDKKQG